MWKTSLLSIVITALVATATPNFARGSDTPANISPKKNFEWSEFERIPVQSGGRIKPLSTYAQEIVLYITSSGRFSNNGHRWQPSELLLSWVTETGYWLDQAIFKIGHVDTRRQLLLEENRNLFTPRELFRNPTVLQYLKADGVQAPAPDDKRLPAREQDLKRVLYGLLLFDHLLQGQAWPLFPEPAPAAWRSFIDAKNEKEEGLKTAFLEIIAAYYKNQPQAFNEKVPAFRQALLQQIPGFSSAEGKKIDVEHFYNRVRPFHWSWIFYFLSALFFALLLWSKKKPFQPPAQLFLVTAVLAHLTGLTCRIWIAGRPPVTNMYETVVWVGLLSLVFALIVYAIQRELLALFIGTTLSGILLLLSESAPAVLDPTLNPLVAVLRSNFWLTIHVLTITTSYAAFALCFGIGNATLIQYLKKKPSPAGHFLQKIEAYNRLNYRAMQFGVVLIAAGTILGGVWADYSWGRFWGWDPKEVWALIALLAYLALLHGRMAGWVTSFGFAAMSIVCFLTVLMSWYGVNFILGAGLHSYGFASGGTGYVVTFCALELVFVLACWLHHRQQTLRQAS